MNVVVLVTINMTSDWRQTVIMHRKCENQRRKNTIEKNPDVAFAFDSNGSTRLLFVPYQHCVVDNVARQAHVTLLMIHSLITQLLILWQIHTKNKQKCHKFRQAYSAVYGLTDCVCNVLIRKKSSFRLTESKNLLLKTPTVNLVSTFMPDIINDNLNWNWLPAFSSTGQAELAGTG